MNKTELTIIKTSDTGKEYTFNKSKVGPNPNLGGVFAVNISIAKVNINGDHTFSKYDSGTTLYLERKTLVDAGMVPLSQKEYADDVKPARAIDDVVIELLEHVGVYPNYD